MRKKHLSLTLIFVSIMVVCVLATCSKPTEACFTYSPAAITTSTLITFSSSCSQNASYFTWNFGDNTTDTTVTTQTITRSYTSTGTYVVTLNAERKDGATLGKDKLTSTQTITVQ